MNEQSPKCFSENNLDRNDFYLCLSFVAVALLIRFSRIGNFELWLDEAGTYHQMVAPDFLVTLLNDYVPPLYSIVARIWGAVCGYSEAAIRAPSAIFGGLFVAAVYLAAKRIINRNAALWCAVLVLLSPIHIYYSQEARSYSLFLLQIILLDWMVWEAQETNRTIYWLWAGLIATTALYTHPLVLLPLLATASFVVFSSNCNRKLILTWFCVVVLVPFILFVPWVVASVTLIDHGVIGADWIKPLWDQTSKILTIPMSLDAFSFLSSTHVFYSKIGRFTAYEAFMGSGFKYIARLVLAFLLLYGVYGSVAASALAERTLRSIRMVCVAMLLPLALLFLISFVKPLYIISRYDLIGYPAFILVIGSAFSRIQSRAAGLLRNRLLIAVTVAWFVPMGVFLYHYQHMPRIVLKSARAAAIKSAVRDGDVVVFTGFNTYQQLYYLDRYGFTCRSWSCADQTGTLTFAYRFFPLANEHSSAAYDDRAYADDPVSRAEEEFDQILGTRRNTASNVLISFDAPLVEGKIDFKFHADALLMDAIVRNKFETTVVSDKFPIVRCRPGPGPQSGVSSEDPDGRAQRHTLQPL